MATCRVPCAGRKKGRNAVPGVGLWAIAVNSVRLRDGRRIRGIVRGDPSRRRKTET